MIAVARRLEQHFAGASGACADIDEMTSGDDDDDENATCDIFDI